jgi:hypothetical protein
MRVLASMIAIGVLAGLGAAGGCGDDAGSPTGSVGTGGREPSSGGAHAGGSGTGRGGGGSGEGGAGGSSAPPATCERPTAVVVDDDPIELALGVDAFQVIPCQAGDFWSLLAPMGFFTVDVPAGKAVLFEATAAEAFDDELTLTVVDLTACDASCGSVEQAEYGATSHTLLGPSNRPAKHLLAVRSDGSRATPRITVRARETDVLSAGSCLEPRELLPNDYVTLLTFPNNVTCAGGGPAFFGAYFRVDVMPGATTYVQGYGPNMDIFVGESPNCSAFDAFCSSASHSVYSVGTSLENTTGAPISYLIHCETYMNTVGPIYIETTTF